MSKLPILQTNKMWIIAGWVAIGLAMVLSRPRAAVVAAAGQPSTDAPREDDVSRMETFCESGKGVGVLNGFKEADLLRHEGKGCLTHMWFGGDWPGYEKTRIRVYIDGETTASIDMELGLGHGYGFADQAAPWGIERLGKTGHPSGVYNTYQIPFGKSVRVTAQRSRESPDEKPFWWIVRGTDNRPVTIGGMRLPSSARLKLIKQQDIQVKASDEFSLCDVQGAGMLYQVMIAARPMSVDKLEYMEGCLRGYFGGSGEPVLLSSGLEDYFLGTYYFNRGRFANELAGLTHLDSKDKSFSGYRFHDADSVIFRNGFRLTCRNGETWFAQRNSKPHGDPGEVKYTTYTWVYQW
jgi:hypothetical protein